MNEQSKPRKYSYQKSTDLDLRVPSREEIYLWDGLLMRNGLNALVGESGAGKSILARRIAEQMSAGGVFLGRPLPQQRVMTIDMETPEAVFRDQMQYFKTNENWFFIRPNETWADIAGLDADRKALLDLLRELKIDFVVLDPLSLIWPVTEENDNAQATFQLGGVRNLFVNNRIGVLYTWNTGLEDSGRQRGASARRDRVDIELNYTKTADGRRRLTVIKDKYVEPDLRMVLKFEGDYNFKVEDDGPISASEPLRVSLGRRIIQMVGMGLNTRGKLLIALEDTNLSSRTIDRTLRDLVDEGKLEQDNKSVYLIPGAEII